MQTVKIISKLKKITGKSGVLIDKSSKALYGKDLTQQHKPNPLAITFPRNEQSVIDIVKLANEKKTALVPSGGRTGYSGGAVASNHEIVVSFVKMNKIISFNKKDKLLTCEPGVTLKTVQEFASNNQLYYPVDFAPSDTCQIGGNIATNAGGIKVIRYGLTRDRVAGLKVVTGKGDLLELNYGLTKNTAGYDFRHLFIGSEGTLGFIVEATLKLIAQPPQTKAILLAITDKLFLIEILNVFQEKLQVTAFEFFSEGALQHVVEASHLVSPFSQSAPFYALLEYESTHESDVLANILLRHYLTNNLLLQALVSENSEQFNHFWRFRKEISQSLLKYFPYKYDIAVLPSKIPVFMEEIDTLFKEIYKTMQIIWFGHVGDGNLHLNILKPKKQTEKEFFSFCEKMSSYTYSIVKKHQGTVSAEHGIGLIKKPFLFFTRSENEIEYMRSIKNAFDPNNIMNPGKIF